MRRSATCVSSSCVRGRTPQPCGAGWHSVREAARRVTGEEAYEVQLMGALALYHGRIVEMLTGEGKTLTGSHGRPAARVARAGCTSSR
jgi:hypothetical protein